MEFLDKEAALVNQARMVPKESQAQGASVVKLVLLVLRVPMVRKAKREPTVNQAQTGYPALQETGAPLVSVDPLAVMVSQVKRVLLENAGDQEARAQEDKLVMLDVMAALVFQE